MTNTFLIDGESDPDELLAQTPTGVYVAKLGGDRSTRRPGTSCSEPSSLPDRERPPHGAAARRQPDRHGPETLRRIDAVANDFATSPGTCGKDGQSVPVGTGQPTLRITGVTIGGTAGD